MLWAAGRTVQHCHSPLGVQVHGRHLEASGGTSSMVLQGPFGFANLGWARWM